MENGLQTHVSASIYTSFMHHCSLVCLTVCPHICQQICMSIHMSVHPSGTFVQPYVCQFVPWDIQEDICMSVMHPCICQYRHLSISPAIVCLHLWIYGYHVDCSFNHSPYCLYNLLLTLSSAIQAVIIAAFVCSLFIMPQDAVMTTIPPVMVLCSSTS